MPGRKIVIAGLFWAGCASWMGAQEASPPDRFQQSGRRALEWTRRVVELGPRPPGSQAHQQQQRIIARALRSFVEAVGGSLHFHRFTAQTPKGPVPMNNIIGKFPGTSDRIVVVSGHYDTYHRDGLHFVGANDGGSSTGFLLALAEFLAAGKELGAGPSPDTAASRPKNSIWVVLFDGEESFVRWSASDGAYGSRRLAAAWLADGTTRRLQALINVDMIGDRDLQLVPESGSTPWLRRLIWRTAARLGYGAAFPSGPRRSIEDDHIPFIKAGVPAVDLIDFQYGPAHRYWHSEDDTVDKVSARSFAIMMHVMDAVLAELDRARWPRP